MVNPREPDPETDPPSRTRLRSWFGSFWLQLSLIFGTLYFVVVGLGQFYMAEFLTERMTKTQGEALHQQTQAIANALGESLHERDREIAMLARLPALQSGPLDADWVEHHLNEIQRSFPNYSWIGVADAQGLVQAATSGVLRGARVRQRPWFSGGERASYLRDAPGRDAGAPAASPGQCRAPAVSRFCLALEGDRRPSAGRDRSPCDAELGQ